MWIEDDVDAAGVLVFVKNLRPSLAAIRGAKFAALLVRPECMAERCDEHHVRILRVNYDPAYLTAVF